jgi:23S rRNA-/tRNA-specific pseudouridylate synthase
MDEDDNSKYELSKNEGGGGGSGGGDNNNTVCDVTTSVIPVRQEQQQQTRNTTPPNNKNKRGMKPRSKRNRKRPRSELHTNDHLTVEATIVPLMTKQPPVISDDPLQPNKNRGSGSSRKMIRVLQPYLYTYCSHAKARWIGRTVLDVYRTDFGSYPASYYQIAIEQGRILVSDRRVPITYTIRGGDVLSHTVHRHEPAVLVSDTAASAAFATAALLPSSDSGTPPTEAGAAAAARQQLRQWQLPIRVVQETDTLLALDKPCTLPVHPCGGYHSNSLMKIVQDAASMTSGSCQVGEDGTGTTNENKLYTIHRLDRLTSGLVVLAKTSAVAQEWGQAIQHRDSSVQKLYLARVRGRFPQNLQGRANQAQELLPRLSQPAPYGVEDVVTAEAATTTTSAGIAHNRTSHNHAHGYWIEHVKTADSSTDRHLGERTTVYTLEDVARFTHTVDEWLTVLDNTGSMRTLTDDENDPFLWLHMVCPVRVEQHKNGVCASGTFDDLDNELYERTVKPAHTAFAVIEYNPADDSTVLLVQPWTGRTHQIRLALQYVGHCIANDPNYGGEMWFGNDEGKRACEGADAILRSVDDGGYGLVTTDDPATESEIQMQSHSDPRGEQESLQEFVQRTCVWCARQRGHTIEQRARLEFLVRSPGLWLHALRYKVNGTAFCTELPDWAKIESQK